MPKVSVDGVTFTVTSGTGGSFFFPPLNQSYTQGKVLTYLDSAGNPVSFGYPTARDAMLAGHLRAQRKPSTNPQAFEESDYRSWSVPELVTVLKRNSDLYYQNPSHEALLDDSLYDRYEERLRYLDPRNPFLKEIGSDLPPPEETKGWDGYPKARHHFFLGSQQKARTPEEFRKWFAKMTKSEPREEYVVQFKYDGISLELQYEEGLLTKAITRGDGTVGDLITENVKRMSGVVLKIPPKRGEPLFTGSLRGEILMDRGLFEREFLPAGHKNPRNMAAGIAKQKPDPQLGYAKGVEYLTVTVYDLWSDDPHFKDLTENEKALWLVEHLACAALTHGNLRSAEAIIQLYERYANSRREIPFDIDGIVIKANTVNPADMERDRPERQIALKFPPTEAVTKLLDVIWHQSGTTFTPVAILEPVEISGSTVSKASLANPNLIIRLEVQIGDQVVVTKRGEIIPKIERVVGKAAHPREIEVPKICPTCDSELINEGTKLRCDNPECNAKLLHQLEKWIKVLDIKEFGKEMLKAIYREGLVKSISGLYMLTVPQLAELMLTGRRVGEKNALKVHENLHNKRVLSLSKFLGGLDITSIGERMIEICIAGGLTTLSQIRTATPEVLSTIRGIGEVKARLIYEGLQRAAPEIEALLKYVRVEAPVRGDRLAGLSFAFTGTLKAMTRDKAFDRVKALGGSTRTSVSRGTTYLVTNDPHSTSKKNLDALALGLQVISEAQFLSLIGD